MTRHTFLSFAVAATLAAAAPAALAALDLGAKAPDFSTDAALAGKPFKFALAEALARGPVVLFFFPKAFTSGCTVEAHQFAEATPRFQQFGATVVGISNDDLPTLQRFSVEACRDKFAVASDADARVIRAYDAKIAFLPGTAKRVSYVIGRDGRVAYVYESMDPDEHVANTLKVVERLAAPRASTAAAPQR
ncbi:peroxiredoxin [Rubrivivax gelatinosus]|uniref:peroxiredoxin n=1 Tax=Rubrivivax gelatinosus TaxID=28068 RepID=UPI00190551CD|nr:peroxiredoxin [Rubrivivax gelatinosus]MBK1615019.1 peroxiredoxin [Rubrivivax gelatinosus]